MHKRLPSSVSTITALLLSALFCVTGVAAGYQFAAVTNAKPLVGVAQPDADFTPVWKAWALIDEKFVPAAISTSTERATTTEGIAQERVWGMVQGLAASLGDPYTHFMPPQEAEQFESDMSGLFEGVGMEIDVRDEVLTVVTPLKGTPAEKAGIKSGDLILKIDGVSTDGISVEAAIKKIRGPKGTQVTLHIYREGWTESKDIFVTRDVINVPIVVSKMRDDGIFVISVATFTSNSPDLFREALREFIESGSSKLIIDVRGNPGGYLDAAVSMASWFLPSGKVVVTEDYAGHSQNIVHKSLGYDVFNENLDLIILIDKGSASASEILANALRIHGVARLVGTNSFGKGSVQELVPITEDTALKITVARWIGPDGNQIPLTGIVPDVEVKVSDEDRTKGRDPQLERAAQLLLK